ncbi:cation-translocating P-type ATPase [Paenibacillus piri]|uniref:Cation-transporting P-type ATPase n=1 Tax=Paenibacillus piri TaxID=2547395 RepID=A0A4R5KJ15_9BACL|nr:cation-transporting P-type ATPase [Paenibacillus piri]TDF95112.1 cation-transporting P-type ATPase [Paenibacillus piri]
MMNHSTSWHSVSKVEIIRTFDVGTDVGLTSSEAELRKRKYGKNELPAAPDKPLRKEIIEELTEPMILLLMAVGAIYGFLGEIRDAMTIMVIIVAVLAIEIGNESRAKGAIKALAKFNVTTCPVLRDGTYQEIGSAGLVPGDIVFLRAGERVPADLRLLECAGLRIDESSLTGESVPVDKNAVLLLARDTALGERQNLAYSGTLVVSGKGKGLVVGTGASTELGQIAGYVQTAKEPRTPLQLHMRELAKRMVWIALGFSLLIAAIGWIGGTGWKNTVLTALSLAFATIPEELPILIAMVLGLGAYRLSKKKAIVRRLKTAETLGSVTVVATDKTGTLTENRMQVQKWFIDGKWHSQSDWNRSQWTDMAVQISVLANDAVITELDESIGFHGDPTDAAFCRFAADTGYDVVQLKRSARPVREFPLTEDSKRITIALQKKGGFTVMTKGAPEQVLALSSYAVVDGTVTPLTRELRSRFSEQAGQLADQGYRIIAAAYKEGATEAEFEENAFTWVGLAAMIDPPRPNVGEAIEALHQAGVRVVMMTGDHAGTAATVGRQIGLKSTRVATGNELDLMTEGELVSRLEHTNVYARTAPQHKLRLVRALQQQGEVVALTGDGVNDGPALKEAAVGIAMGKSGTDVAKESADLILTDDDFSTLPVAIQEGRKLFANLRKSVAYYLAAKTALIASTLVPVLAGMTLPFTPIQIIVMELFLDIGAASSFTAEPPESDVMKRPPERTRRFLDKRMMTGIFSGGLSLGLAVLAAYLISWSMRANTEYAQTVAFSTWMLGHLWLAMMMRSEREPLLSLGLLTNKVMLLWIAAAALFLALTQTLPVLSGLLHLVELKGTDWIFVLGCSFVVPLWMEIKKMIAWHK